MVGKYNIPNEWSRKKIQENNMLGSFVEEHKRKMIFHFFKMLLISKRA
jgi:hypothetical protein